MRVKVGKLIWQNIAVGKNVESFFAEALLHLHDVLAQAVLPRQLIAHREVVDLLVLAHLLIDVAFNTLTRPLDVPLVALRLIHAVCFKNGFDKTRIGFHHFEEHVKLRLLILAWLREAQHVDVVTIDLMDNKRQISFTNSASKYSHLLYTVYFTYECDVFRHFEVDKLLYPLCWRTDLSDYTSRRGLHLILQRLAHARIRQLLLFIISDAIHELQKVLETIVLKLRNK